MSEIWDNPFGHALLKIKRANQHIADFKQRLRTSSDRYGPSLKLDAETGEKFLYYGLDDRYLPSDLALIAGDAIHNLRSALDIAWVEIVRKNGKPISDQTKFPIAPKQTENWLKSVLPCNAGVEPTSPIFDFIVNRVKCYKGGDSDMLALHDLDIGDKHLLLIPMLAVTGITGVELENEDGTIDRFDIKLTRLNPYRRPVGLETKLKNHGEVRFQITFREGIATQGFEVVPTLRRFSRKTLLIVRFLQRVR